jgi:mRNA-degrading endonuclease RelE of RelBE toxin-antitoxin system
VDRITKALKRLTVKQREQLLVLIEQVESGDTRGLDVLKLKGFRQLYRVRKGDLRLIVKRVAGQYRVLTLETRSERTYGDVRPLDD